MNTFNGNSRRLYVVVVFSLLILTLLLSGVWSVMAQDGLLPLPISGGSRIFTQGQQLTAWDQGIDSQFGKSVILNDNTLFVASVSSAIPTDFKGAVYVFKSDASGKWSPVTKVTGSDIGEQDSFGASIDVYGNTLVVGAPGHDVDDDDTNGKDEGAAYIFNRALNGGWLQVQKIMLPMDLGRFGSRVAIDGDSMVITAYGAGVSPAAYLFTRNTATNFWQFKYGVSTNKFIDAVALEGDTLLLASTILDEVHVYRREADGDWIFVTTFTASDLKPLDSFGRRLELSGNLAYVSAETKANGTDTFGAVYVFKRLGDTWTQIQKIMPDDQSDYDGFGSDFAIEGDLLAISSPYDDTPPSTFMAGSVYFFNWNGSTWLPKEKIGPVGGYFGYSIDLQNSVLVSGAPDTDDSTGRVYIYNDLAPTPTPTVPPTTEPSVELLVDGGFENDGVGWNIKNATGDKVKCNKTGKVIAYAGNCAWRFKSGAGENAKIQQVITTGFATGDTLTLSGYVNASGAINGKVKLVLSYLNAALEKDKITISLLADTSGGYTALSHFETDLTTSVVAPPEKIKLQVKNSSISGKLYIDSFSITAQAQ